MTVDKIDKFVIYDTNQKKIYQLIFKILNCNAFWMIHVKDNALRMLVTDRHILEHYWDKKYYRQDPALHLESRGKKRYHIPDNLPFQISLGTEEDRFKNAGFLSDLYRMFQVGEFVSIMKRTKTDYYCFRFFTRNSRFGFLNKLLNEMPIIKHFIEYMIKQYTKDFSNHAALNLTKLKNSKVKTRTRHVIR